MLHVISFSNLDLPLGLQYLFAYLYALRIELSLMLIFSIFLCSVSQSLSLLMVLFLLLQRRHLTNSKSSRSEMMISTKDNTFVNNHSKHRQSIKEKTQSFLDYQRRQISHSGPLVKGMGQKAPAKGCEDPPVVSSSSRGTLSTLSGFVASRTSSSEDRRGNGPSNPVGVRQVGCPQESFNEFVCTGKQDRRHNVQKVMDSPEGGGVENTGVVSFLFSSSLTGCFYIIPLCKLPQIINLILDYCFSVMVGYTVLVLPGIGSTTL